RDRKRGGTWLGINGSGSYAAVTNFRAPSEIKKGAPSRGHLVSDFLHSTESPASYLERIAATSSTYNGFNLIAGDSRQLAYHSNKDAGVRDLAPGIYGLSNHLLDTSWPKVSRGKQALTEIVRQAGEVEPETLFAILADESKAEDQALPDTGVGVEVERVLSPLFIRTPIYGTRSSTLLLIDIEDSITFIERTFDAGMKDAADAVFKFKSEGEP
ncbi:MAG: NRDE family protein, partial [Pyrinomonadaceae bacterium]|nr:NRDE family protein [Pyrinomonadaceae bacterium]